MKKKIIATVMALALSVSIAAIPASAHGLAGIAAATKPAVVEPAPAPGPQQGPHHGPQGPQGPQQGPHHDGPRH